MGVFYMLLRGNFNMENNRSFKYKNRDEKMHTKNSINPNTKTRVLEYIIDPIEKIHTFVCPQDTSMPHIHRFLELAYVIEGSAVHGMNGEEAVISRGDYIIIDLGDIHYYKALESGTLKIRNLLFLPEFVDRMLVNAKSFSEILNCYLVKCSNGRTPSAVANRIFHDGDGHIFEILEHLAHEYEEKKLGYLETIRCALIELIIETVRKAAPEHRKSDIGKAMTNSTESICEYITENYMKNITLSDICTEKGYSVPYVSRKFKEENGMTFSRYLQQMRINEARRLLSESNKKIIDIAEIVGYSDIKFFNSLFKKYTGKTPREYRKLSRS